MISLQPSFTWSLFKKVLFVSCLITSSMDWTYAQSQIQWEHSYGGSDRDVLNKICSTPDGGFLLSGGTFSQDGNINNYWGRSDAWVVKLDAEGELLWSKTYGGSKDDEFQDFIFTADGGYLFVGFSESDDGDVDNNYGITDYWVVKTDAIGDIEWEKNYGGFLADIPFSVVAANDGGYLIAGFSSSQDGDVGGTNGSNDFWLLKIGLAGNIEWEQNYGGMESDIARQVTATPDGGYLVMGVSPQQEGSGWLIKVDALGTLEWEKHYASTVMRQFMVMRPTSDGGYLIGGTADPSEDNVGMDNLNDIGLLKITADGVVEWAKTFGGTGFEHLRDIQIAPSTASYFIIADSGSDDGDVGPSLGIVDFWVLEISPAGTLIWTQNFGGSSSDQPLSLQVLENHQLVIAGLTSSMDGDVGTALGNVDAWVVQLNNLLTSTDTSPTTQAPINLFPNPTTGWVQYRGLSMATPIQMEVMTSQGQLLQRNYLNGGAFNLSHLPAGAYLVRGIHADGVWVEWVIKE
ncbi:MAG: T9SS type A sorting domain-containing protein [Bacteroidota bacterium]